MLLSTSGYLVDNWSRRDFKFLKIHNSLIKDIAAIFLNLDVFSKNVNNKKIDKTLSQRNLFS